MSTRSNIGYYEDGKLYVIYCHYDGYPEYVGRILTECYKDFDKVKELISYGDLSCLGENIHPTDKSHSFNTPQDGVCVFYTRDRGDSFQITRPCVIECECNTAEDIKNIVYGTEPTGKTFANSIAYVYIYFNGEWLTFERS